MTTDTNQSDTDHARDPIERKIAAVLDTLRESGTRIEADSLSHADCDCETAAAQRLEIDRLRGKLRMLVLDFRILIELYRFRGEPLPFVLRHADELDHLIVD